MTLPEIADSIIREAQGGVRTSESKFSTAYLYELIHQTRAAVLKATFSGDKNHKRESRIQAVWTQQYVPEYSADLQDIDATEKQCVKFEVPPVIALDATTDGLLYIGALNGNCAYRKVNSRAELAMYNNHQVTNKTDDATGGYVTVLYSDNILEVYKNSKIWEIRIDAIFENPTLLPTYNIKKDAYPVDAKTLAELKILILQTITEREAGTTSDPIQDNADPEGKSKQINK